MPSEILEGDAEVEVCGCGHFSFWHTRQGLTKQRRRHARVAGIEVHDRGVVQGGGVHEQSSGVRQIRNVTLSRNVRQPIDRNARENARQCAREIEKAST